MGVDLHNDARFLIYEQVPFPIVVVGRGAFVYGNPAFAKIFGFEQHTPLDAETLLRELVAPAEQDAVRVIIEGMRAGENPPVENWVTLRCRGLGGELRMYWTGWMPGPGPAEWTVTLVESPAESAAHKLATRVMAEARRLLTCVTEHDVLVAATDALYAQGYSCGVLLFEGEMVVHGPFRQERDLASALAVAGGAGRLRFPRDVLPHHRALFVEKRAVFHPDLHAILRKVYPREVADELRRISPVLRALEAPLFVAGNPYGIIFVQSPDLPPSVGVTLELFAQLASVALETARQHKLSQQKVRQLRRMQEELVSRERLAALGQAAALVAHEVRNPLASIVNCVALLRQWGGGPPHEEVLRMMEEESFRLERMVRHLLDFTRPLVPEPRPLRCAELTRATFRALQERGEGISARLVLNQQGDDGLEADETLLQLAIENLLRNSLQAAPQGSSLRVDIRREGDNLVFSIEDEGPGIPPEKLTRVFEPFFTTRASGSGLGLSLVKRVAEVHGGHAVARNSASGGARMELSIPVRPPEAAGEPLEASGK